MHRNGQRIRLGLQEVDCRLEASQNILEGGVATTYTKQYFDRQFKQAAISLPKKLLKFF